MEAKSTWAGDSMSVMSRRTHWHFPCFLIASIYAGSSPAAVETGGARFGIPFFAVELVGHFRRYAERASVRLHHRGSQLHHRRRSARLLTHLLEFLYSAQLPPRGRSENIHMVVTCRVLRYELLCATVVGPDVFRPLLKHGWVLSDRQIIDR